MILHIDHCRRAVRRRAPNASFRAQRIANENPGKMTLAALATGAAVLLTFAIALLPRNALAESVYVAVATNFAEPARELGRAFARRTPHTAKISTGATGALYAQIKAGAPFGLFLAADSERPEMLERAGKGVVGSRFTYAIGQLVLWCRDASRCAEADGRTILTNDDYRALAIADPKLAPYGKAARATLDKLGVWQQVHRRLVFGTNIGQTFAMVATGNAELGFVALSQLKSAELRRDGNLDANRADAAKLVTAAAGKTATHWLVPAGMHAPIRQDAIMLNHGKDNAAAHAFIAFLKSREARSLIARFGYETTASTP